MNFCCCCCCLIMCPYTGACVHISIVVGEARGLGWTAWVRSSRWWWAPWPGYQEVKAGPLKRQTTLLTIFAPSFPSAQFKLSDWGSESGRLTNFRAIFIDTKNLMLSVCFSAASPIMSHREIVHSLPNDPFQFSLISLASSAPARTLSSGAIEVFYVISF